MLCGRLQVWPGHFFGDIIGPSYNGCASRPPLSSPHSSHTPACHVAPLLQQCEIKDAKPPACSEQLGSFCFISARICAALQQLLSSQRSAATVPGMLLRAAQYYKTHCLRAAVVLRATCTDVLRARVGVQGGRIFLYGRRFR